MCSFASISVAIVALLYPVFAAPTSATVNGQTYSIDSSIIKDVVIIGGGSGGTYSAISIRDSGKSIVVVEATDRLGGHTQTYIEPTTGFPIEYGVEFFHNQTQVLDYFTRLNVSYAQLSIGSAPPTTYIDFQDGKENLTYIAGGSQLAFEEAFATYASQAENYPLLDYGYDLPSPVPSDLFLPFKKFVAKYALDALVPFAWSFTQGIGNLLQVPTLYVLKSFGLSDILSIQEGFLHVTPDNSAIYLAAQSILGTDVLYSSTVLAVERGCSGDHTISVVLKTGGKTILIQAKRLIISIQPTLGNLAPVDLDDHERDLFSKFKYTNYFTGILANTGLPSTLPSLTAWTPTGDYNIPLLPSIYQVSNTGFPGLWNVWFDSTTDLSDADIEKLIIDAVEGADVPGKTHSTPTFVVSSNHKPFSLEVSSDDIKDGFYTDLYALQGVKDTWYISATFIAHDSSLIWRYAQSVIPGILSSI